MLEESEPEVPIFYTAQHFLQVLALQNQPVINQKGSGIVFNLLKKETPCKRTPVGMEFPSDTVFVIVKGKGLELNVWPGTETFLFMLVVQFGQASQPL